MKTIKLAPGAKDCRVEGNKIIGKWDKRTIVLTIPVKATKAMIEPFRAAIAMSSKPWQVVNALENYWNMKGITIEG